MVVFKLTTTPSFRPGVHNVQGDLVLRDGMYASEADVLLRVQVGLAHCCFLVSLVGVIRRPGDCTLPVPSGGRVPEVQARVWTSLSLIVNGLYRLV